MPKNPFFIILIIGGVALGALYLAKQDNQPSPAGGEVAAETATDSTPVPAAQNQADVSQSQPTTPTAPLPGDETKLIATINDAWQAYQAAANDMAKGGVRAERAKKLCQQFPKRTVKEWVGTVETLSSTSKGDGVLAIKIADNIDLATWNNGLSDIGDNTLIPAGSALFNAAASLKAGEAVTFSGKFISADDDCFRESSFTQEGAMSSPDFVFRFSQVAPD